MDPSDGRRDKLERDFDRFQIGLLLKKDRANRHLTQLAELVDRKREFISRIENNGSNLTFRNPI